MARSDDGKIFSEAYAFGQRLRRAMHRHPELSGREFASSSLLQRELQAIGYQVESIDGGPSFLAFSPSCNHFRVGLRAELDALPITEQNASALASATPGVMHACGHDMHMGVACAFAYYLSRQPERDAGGGVLFVFESSEEVLPGGARAILSSASFQRRRPDAMLAFHCDPGWPVGTLASRPGAYMASGDELHFTVRGKGGHGALPQDHDDPLLAAAHLVVALQSVTTRTVPAAVPAVLSIGRFEARGTTNVVPDEVKLQGTFRTHSEEWRAKGKEAIRRVAQGVGAAHGVAIEANIIEGYPTLTNSPALFERAVALQRELHRVTRFETVEPRMTTDDFAYFAQQIPSLYLRLGVGTASGGLHTPTFCPDEEAIAVALEWLAACYELQTPG